METSEGVDADPAAKRNPGMTRGFIQERALRLELLSRTQSKLDFESDSETNAELGIYCEMGSLTG